MNRQRWTTWLVAAAAATAAACGSDEEDRASGTERSPDAGASAGAAAVGGRGGSNAAAKSPAAGSGGQKSTDQGNAKGKDTDKDADDQKPKSNDPAKDRSSAAASGDADAGADLPAYPRVEKLAEHVFKQANDLRGLTFSASGKIWASGHSDADPMNRKLVLARFNADGTPDSSFDEDGFRTYDIVPGDEQSLGLVELEGGDVVVQANVSDGRGGAPIPDMAGGPDGVRANGSNIVLLRFTQDGELVRSFGQDGIAQLQLGWAPEDDASWPAPTYNSSAAENMRYSTSGYPSDQAWGVLLDHSGKEEKLVVNAFGPPKKVETDQRYDNDRYIVRVLASTGAFDPAWNGGRPYTFNTQGTLPDGGRRAFLEADGTVVSAGYTNFGMGLGNHVVLMRLEPDGTPDESFGFGPVAQPGLAIFNPFVDSGGVAECYSVTKQAGGRYITTGYGRATAANTASKLGYATTDGVDLVSFAVKADGKGVDTSWGIEGTRAIQSEERGLGATEDRGRDLVALPDGRTLQVGRFGTSPAIFVLTPDGQLDTGSGDKGVLSYAPFSTMPSHFFAAALSRDGKQLAAATNNHAEGVLLAVVKINQ